MEKILEDIAYCESLSDAALTIELAKAVENERFDLIRVLVRLGAFYNRDLSRRKGCPSAYAYCGIVLGYSRSAAGRRIVVAKRGKEFPSMLAMIAAGELSLCAAAMLASHLTSSNHRTVLSRAKGRDVDDVAVLVAQLAPGSSRRDAIRAVAPPPAPMLYRVSFDARPETLALLRRGQELLRHRFPMGELDGIVAAALDGLLERADRDRRAKRKIRRRHARERARNRTRLIPEEARQRVWERDGGACAWIGTDGRRCGSREGLQFDHVAPCAAGGASDDASNVRVLCRGHSLQRARDRFGSYANGSRK